MQLRINDSAKFIEVWLTGAENGDAAVQASLAPVLEKYRAEKYRPVFFVSGSGDLQESTADLLRCRRRKMGDIPLR